jgi:hypothetical protein
MTWIPISASGLFHAFDADVRGLGAGVADPVLDEDLRTPRLVYGNAVGR